MLEQISELVKHFGKQVVVENPDVPNDQNNAVMTGATSTIAGGMQNMLAGGGFGDIISMFTGKNPGQNSRGGGIGDYKKTRW